MDENFTKQLLKQSALKLKIVYDMRIFKSNYFLCDNSK